MAQPGSPLISLSEAAGLTTCYLPPPLAPRRRLSLIRQQIRWLVTVWRR